MTDPYAGVPGQERAVAALHAAARQPVHAYLFVGPPGVGKRAAATAFAADVLCPQGGDGTCEVCRRVLSGTHPDVVVVEREGAAISIDTAREVARLAARSPVEGSRKVLVLEDFHLVKEAGPALLKTIEEPPASTVFVILAEHLPPELITIASRCVRVDFAPLAIDRIAEVLVAEGTGPALAADVAVASGGRLDRARLLAADPDWQARREAWASVPARLDGTGATTAALATELMGLLDSSTGPLQARQETEARSLVERNERSVAVNGKVGRGARAGTRTGVRELEERHKREIRRQRTDELKAGLAVLAGAYRDRLAGDPSEPGAPAAIGAVAVIQKLAADLAYNPGELLALQALLVRLDRSPALVPASPAG